MRTTSEHKAENATVTARVFHLLSDLRWHSVSDLKRATGGGRYSARLYDLELDGYKIARRDDGRGKAYRLLSKLPGRPRKVKVKVYLEAADVRRLLNGAPATTRASRVLRAALGRFEENTKR